MATLEEISSRLEQGYFLKEDMETLGLSGYVSLAQMRAEVASLLTVEHKQQAEAAAKQEIIDLNKQAFEQALAKDSHVKQTPKVLEPKN
jgi:hypothetical protein